MTLRATVISLCLLGCACNAAAEDISLPRDPARILELPGKTKLACVVQNDVVDIVQLKSKPAEPGGFASKVVVDDLLQKAVNTIKRLTKKIKASKVPAQKKRLKARLKQERLGKLELLQAEISCREFLGLLVEQRKTSSSSEIGNSAGSSSSAGLSSSSDKGSSSSQAASASSVAISSAASSAAMSLISSVSSAASSIGSSISSAVSSISSAQSSGSSWSSAASSMSSRSSTASSSSSSSNQPPTIPNFSLGSFQAGTTGTRSLYITDPNAGDTVTLTVSGLPPFASFTDGGNRSGTLTITPTTADISETPYSFTFMASDGVNPSVSRALSFQVIPLSYTMSGFVNIGSGSITRTPNQTYYLPGSTVTVEAVPSAGWKFYRWEEGLRTYSYNPITFTMTQSHSLAAWLVVIASYTYTPASPVKNQAITFSANVPSGASNRTFSWTFGDGTTGSGSTVTHTYTAAGSYSVGLTVRDASGGSNSSQQTIIVGN